MNQKSIPTTKPTLEDVRHRFEQWRAIRKHRTPIPDSLWEEAVSLSAGHSIHKISKALRLGYTTLKRRMYASRSGNLPEAVSSSAFVELDLRASMPDAECIVEMEDRYGSKMKMYIKGKTGLNPPELIKAFWGKGPCSR